MGGLRLQQGRRGLALGAASQGYRRGGELRRCPARELARRRRPHPCRRDHRPVRGLRRRLRPAHRACLRRERGGRRCDGLCEVEGQGRRRAGKARRQLADREALARDRARQPRRHLPAARPCRAPLSAAVAGRRKRALPAHRRRRSRPRHRASRRRGEARTDDALCRRSRDCQRPRYPRGVSRLARLRQSA